MSQIDYQLSDYQNSISNIEEKFDLIRKSLKETLSDHVFGK